MGNEEMDIFVKYTYDKKFEMDTPWIDEKWEIKNSEEMMEFMYESNMMDRWMAEMDFKQGMEAAFIQSEMDKCMLSVEAAHEEYGVYLAPKGKECVLKKWDEMVQFCEWADMNGVDKWEK